MKYFVRYVNGIHAMVLLYDKPVKCVNVITHDGTKETKHCYPLTDEQWSVYMDNSPEEQIKLIAKGGKIFK